MLPPGEWDPSIRIEPPANLHSETRKASLLPAAVNSANPSDTKRMKSKNGGNGNGGGGPNKGEVEVGGVVKVDINVDDDHAQVQCSKWYALISCHTSLCLFILVCVHIGRVMLFVYLCLY